MAAAYARHRPRYPRRLTAYLAALAPGRALAWDCATGNGQVAVALAARFAAVVATDASAAQLARARAHPRVRYFVAQERAPMLASGSVDLVTTAQALHWLERASFYAEATRVLRPGGVIALWCYARPRVRRGVDAVIDRLCDRVVGPFWPPERALVEAGYASLALPFEELQAPRFDMRAFWSLAQFEGYVDTWSSAQAYRLAHGRSPVAAVHDDLAAVWGCARQRTVRWPLHLRVARVRG
jgi:SAM-dependent methyltransferase